MFCKMINIRRPYVSMKLNLCYNHYVNSLENKYWSVFSPIKILILVARSPVMNKTFKVINKTEIICCNMSGIACWNVQQSLRPYVFRFRDIEYVTSLISGYEHETALEACSTLKLLRDRDTKSGFISSNRKAPHENATLKFKWGIKVQLFHAPRSLISSRRNCSTHIPLTPCVGG
jgi:hypothetical protein